MIDIVDKFNMVDMGGIDIVESQGVAVEGLFNLLLTAIQNCRYQMLYNWKFAQIEIAPSYVELLFDGQRISINGAVAVTEDDVVHIYSIEEPVYPELEVLNATENGEYLPSDGIYGFSKAIVSVSGGIIELDREPAPDDGVVGDYCISTTPLQADGFCIRITRAARDSDTSFHFWGTAAFRAVFEDSSGNEYNISDLSGANIALSPNGMESNKQQVNSLFTALPTGSYVERSGLPGYFVVHADNLGNYKLKSISFCRRPGTSWRDYVVDFGVYYIRNYQIVGGNLLSVSGLTLSDWPDGQLVTFSIAHSTLPFIKKLYFKTETGWQFITEWS